MDLWVKVQCFGDYLVARMIALNNSEVRFKYLCGYNPLLFTIFLMYSLIFMNMDISKLAYLKLLCLTFIFLSS